MSQFAYTPAAAHDWLAVAATGRLLVVRVQDDDELRDRVSGLELETLTVHDALDALTSHGLAHTPDFALCFWVAGALGDEGLGVIVYGDVAIDVRTADGTRSVRPVGVSGWGEELVEGAAGLVFSPNGDEGDLLPLRSGAVWAGRVELVADGRAAAGGAQPRSTSSATEPTKPVEPEQHASAHVGEPPLSQPPTEPVAVYEESPGIPQPAVPTPPPAVDLEATVIPEATLIPHHLGDAPPEPLDESTVVRRPGTPPLLPPSEGLGDHDGMTVLAADVKAAREGAHVAEHEAAASELPRVSYVLELPGGGRQPLDAPVVLGRAPSVSNVPASVLPHVITLAGDDISRNHARVAVEGDAVVVTDLHSSNGTLISVPGRASQQLRGGEQVPVIAGTVIDLGSGVTLRVLEA